MLFPVHCSISRAVQLNISKVISNSYTPCDWLKNVRRYLLQSLKIGLSINKCVISVPKSADSSKFPTALRRTNLSPQPQLLKETTENFRLSDSRPAKTMIKI